MNHEGPKRRKPMNKENDKSPRRRMPRVQVPEDFDDDDFCDDYYDNNQEAGHYNVSDDENPC